MEFIKRYKWHIIIWCIGLFLIFYYGIIPNLTSENVLLNGVFLNVEKSTDSLTENFIKKENIDTKISTITFNDEYSYRLGKDADGDANYKAVEAIIVQSEEDELDFVMGTLDEMLDIAYNSRFSELTTFLQGGKAKDYEPYFLYIDLAVMEKLEEAYEKEEDISKIQLPDCRKPEEMKEPVAVLLDVSQCEELAAIYGDSKNVVMGLISEAPHQTMVYSFLDYIYPRTKQ